MDPLERKYDEEIRKPDTMRDIPQEAQSTQEPTPPPANQHEAGPSNAPPPPINQHEAGPSNVSPPQDSSKGPLRKNGRPDCRNLILRAMIDNPNKMLSSMMIYKIIEKFDNVDLTRVHNYTINGQLSTHWSNGSLKNQLPSLERIEQQIGKTKIWWINRV